MTHSPENREEQTFNRSRQVHHQGPSFFSSFVSERTVVGAGFNYWETSHSLNTTRGDLALVYISQLEGVNMVVIRNIRKQQDGRHVDWYFGTFKGKHSGQCQTEEELNEYFRNVHRIMTRKNRVPGSELEERIRQMSNRLILGETGEIK
jgi:hypothetical protein